MTHSHPDDHETASTGLATFRDIVDGIQRDFSTLRGEINFDDPETDAIATFPRQPGLDFQISINLQGDELHLNAASFWVEWFPCTDPRVADDFSDAVRGLISGEYRIVEHLVFAEPVAAILQRPNGSRWKTIARWSNLGALLPWPRRKRIIRNLSAPRSVLAT